MEEMLSQQSCDYYNDMYAHYTAHEDLLKDTVRTTAYRDAIFKNKQLFEGKVVLDAGAGTAILGLFAAKAGARVVYSVERTLMAEFAQKIVEANHMTDKIVVIKGSIEEIELPEKVDIILSDWMGSCLFADCSLQSVLVARDRFLKPDGIMFPTSARLVIGAIEDAEYRSQKIGFWDDVYGFTYNSIKKWALVEPLVETCPTEGFLTDESIIAEYDMKTMTIEDITKSNSFLLVPSETNTMHAFVVWFDIFFKGPNTTVSMSTSPYCTRTLWRQTVFYLDEPTPIAPLMCIEGTFAQKADPSNPRNQLFSIQFNVDGNHFSQNYKLSA